MRTGFAPIDHSHQEVDRALVALSSAILSLDEREARRRLGGLVEELSSWAVRGLPDLLRHHALRSDFGFAKFALGVARDPGAR